MNFYAVGPFLVAVATLGFGVFVLISNPKAKLNRLFFCLCVSVSIWAFGYSQMYNTLGNDLRALTWARIGYIGVPFIPVFVYHFIITFLELKRPTLVVGLTYALGVFFLIISRTDLFLDGMYRDYFWGYYPKAGPVYGTFVVFFACLFVRMVLVLYKELRRRVAERLPVGTERIKYVLLGFAIATTSLVDYVPNYGIEIYPWAYLSALGWLLCMGWASFRYRLMGINLAVARVGLFLAIYAPLLAVPFVVGKTLQPWLIRVVGINWWMVPTAFEALFVVGGLTAYRYVQRRAEARILKEQRRYQGMLLNAAKGMTQIHNLERLLNLLAYLLVRAMKLAHASVFLWDDSREQYVLQVKVHPPCKTANSPVECGTHEPLVLWLIQERAPIVQEEVGHLSEARRSGTVALNRLEHRLKHLDAAVVVPSFVNDRLIGFLALGNKRTGTMYSEDDLSMLQTLANQAALAIENAQFYEKERERQAELFHAASIADLGTMASSMSHQINNPLCIISGTAQTREEYLRRALKQDAWSADQVRQLLQAEIESLRSIQQEATDGSNIIATIRGITASTEAARPLLLLEAVNVALPIAQHKVPFNRLDFRRELPESLPRIWGDKAQLAQCIISFFENAWDAIQARQEDRKLPPPSLEYKGLIRLAGSTVTEPHPETKQLTQWVVLTISDNGIGLKPEDLRKLFIPFFTTKATAEKAFGSLFVVRRIIEAHGGTVSADSTYGVGTTFKVKLPALTDEEANWRITAGRNGPVRPK